MNILVIGSGGREHALAWRISQSRSASKVWVAPGNDGMLKAKGLSVIKEKAEHPFEILSICQKLMPDLIVIGPETPLSLGVVDLLESSSFCVFGPRKSASVIESSKIFSKELMSELGIRTAKFKIAESAEEAHCVLKDWDISKGIVLKSDGLAAGKGVVVTNSFEEASKTIDDFMKNPKVSVKTSRLLMEERLTGREVSSFALCDGEDFVFLGNVCDYKRLLDGDEGPNTGGMGGYSPKKWPSKRVNDQIQNEIIKPILKEMKNRGTPFKGVLFVGLMIHEDNAFVIEFNSRFGDPETQVLMPLLEGDFAKVLFECAKGELHSFNEISLKDDFCVHVVKSSAGYPSIDGGVMLLGQRVEQLENFTSEDLCFFAGVKNEGEKLVNSGGRVLGVSALGASLELARKKSYRVAQKIQFEGAHMRNDIGLLE